MGRAEPEASYGRRLMIDIIDGVAASDPERHFLYVPRSGDPKDGWKPVTYKQISRAVDHVAWQIAKAPRPETEEAFPTLAYIGANDVRYVVVMLACIKAGYKAFFISTRNTTEAQLSLFEATDCRLLWHTGAFRESVQAWTGNGKRSTFEVPGAAVWLDSAAEPFPYSRDFEEGRWDPAVVLHTSGSTGIPKPIVVRQGSFAVTDGFRDLVGPRGERFFFQAYADAASKIFSPMPLFHAAAIVVGIGMAVFYERPVVLGIPDRPLSSDLVMDCLHHSGAGGCVLPPSLMAELSLSEEGVAALARLGFAAFGGGKPRPRTRPGSGADQFSQETWPRKPATGSSRGVSLSAI
jgi:acyl-CoA synthetase (AMP-forming)/AMP-acid ligase II